MLVDPTLETMTTTHKFASQGTGNSTATLAACNVSQSYQILYESQRNMEPLFASSSQSEFSMERDAAWKAADPSQPRNLPDPAGQEEGGDKPSPPSQQARCKSQELLVTSSGQDSMDSTKKVEELHSCT